MPRAPRIDFAGAIHHVTTRGVDRARIFRDDADCRLMLELLRLTMVDFDWDCLTYCLNGNHTHLLVRTNKPTLSEGMQWLNGAYARKFNERHERDGHLFQGRFHARVVSTDNYLRNVARYIAWNPVVDGACEAPEDWRWSAHRALLAGGGIGPVPIGLLLEYVGGVAGYRQVIDLGPTRLERKRELKSLLASLPRLEALEAAIADGYTRREIAAALGCHTNSVTRTMNRLRKGSDP